ncbi:hypothetical protein S40288_05422 [Stachybotrys chartarum IBT 40288]|nr:hypothetical protein S40288_05422 [Stachybotrys chartarum IBT 40288]
MGERIVGISRQGFRGSSLLRNLPQTRVSAAPAIDDPPLSTDDEGGSNDGDIHPDSKSQVQPQNPGGRRTSSNSFRLRSLSNCSLSDSDGNAGSRADIRGTKFGTTAKQQQSSGTGSKRIARPETTQTGSQKRRRGHSEADEAQHNDRVTFKKRAPSPTPPTSSADPFTDEHGFTKRTKSVSTYGNRGRSSQSTQSTQSSQPEASKNTVFRKPEDVHSPMKPKTSRLAVPEPFASPSKGPRAQFKEFPQRDNDDETRMSSSPVANTKLIYKRTGKIKAPTNSGRQKRGERGRVRRQAAAAAARSPSPPAAVFRMPGEIPGPSQRTTTNDDKPIASPFDLDDSSDDASLLSKTPTISSDSEEGTTLCPWCGELVDEGLLKDFSKGKRLNVRMQTKFCQRHKKHTAMETWTARNYPRIDWLELEDRMAEHRDSLLGIVNGDESTFRTKLAAAIEAGKGRSLKKEDNLNPGYYGARGFNVMCDYLVREFGDLLKRRAVSDRVIAGRGSAAFIQSVLVAELAVKLIVEDMNVGIEEAMDILEESKALGEIVHEET